MKKLISTTMLIVATTALTSTTLTHASAPTQISAINAINTTNFNNTIINAIISHKTSVDISKFNLSGQDALTKYFYLKNCEPKIWYASDTASIVQQNKKAKIIKFNYDYTEKEILEMQAYIDNVVNRAIEIANTFQNDYDKAKSVYDFLIDSYDYDWTLSKHREYELFQTGTGVCTAYSLAYKDIMQRLGIPCKIVVSREIAHQWNIIKIDESWYNVDPAWGDITEKELKDFKYDNFLKSDYYFKLLGHIGGKAEDDIECTNKKYDF